MLIGDTFWMQGQRDRAFEFVRAAEALIAEEPTSYSKAFVVANVSRYAMLAGEREKAIRLGCEGLEMAEELGNDELRAHVLNNIGTSPHRAGRPAGPRGPGAKPGDRRRGQLSRRACARTATSHPPSSTSASSSGRLRLIAEGIRAAERFGVGDHLKWLTAELAWQPYFEGRWDDALVAARRAHRRLRGGSVLDGDTVPLAARSHAPGSWRSGRRIGRRRARHRACSAGKGSAGAVAGPRVRSPRRLPNRRAASGQLRRRDLLRLAGEGFRVVGERKRVAGRSGRRAHASWSAGRVPRCRSGRGSGIPGRPLPLPTSQETFSTRRSGTPRSAPCPTRRTRDCGRPRLLFARVAGPRPTRELQRSLAVWRKAGATAYIREGEALLAASA